MKIENLFVIVVLSLFGAYFFRKTKAVSSIVSTVGDAASGVSRWFAGKQKEISDLSTTKNLTDKQKKDFQGADGAADKAANARYKKQGKTIGAGENWISRVIRKTLGI